MRLSIKGAVKDFKRAQMIRHERGVTKLQSRRFLWVDNKSIELVRAFFHLFDEVKGDLMRVVCALEHGEIHKVVRGMQSRQIVFVSIIRLTRNR